MLQRAPVLRGSDVTVPVVPALLVALAVAAASLLVARPLGYDAWAWMVWARELTHGALSTADGPALKPLPVVAVLPLARFGDLAPLAWLTAMRACALLCLPAALVAGARLGGLTAGLTAAALVAVEPDLLRTAIYGSSEPLLVLLVLLAATCFLGGAPRAALALLGVGGLMRPELWPLVLVAGGVLIARERRVGLVVPAAVVLPPVVWLGMAWIGAGTAPDRLIHAARPAGVCAGCALAVPVLRAFTDLNHVTDAAGVLRRLGEAFVLPAIVLAIVGTVVAVRRRAREPIVLALFAAAWIGLIAVMAQVGYPGSRRYLEGPAALLALLAGLGLAATVASVHGRRAEVIAAAVIAAFVVAAAAPTIRSDLALVGTARGEQRTQADLRAAVGLVGRERVRAAGRPAINPVMQTALAWDLSAALDDVQATWDSTPRRPHWRPPAYVFLGPDHDAGPAPAFPPGRSAARVGRRGRWLVLRSPAPAPRAGTVGP